MERDEVGGYLGSSTKSNLESAHSLGKQCSFVSQNYASNSKSITFYLNLLIFTIYFISAKDWTFSYQLKGNKVPFGEAGDCFSRLKCPQGRFSINLAGTGLRVSPNTEWESLGSYASQQIAKQDVSTSVIVSFLFLLFLP